MIDMTTPTDAEVREALGEFAVSVVGGRWAFLSHPANVYGEAEALELTRINLMLGTRPNGSLSADMLGRIVDRVADVEQRLRDMEREADDRRDMEMGEDL